MIKGDLISVNDPLLTVPSTNSEPISHSLVLLAYEKMWPELNRLLTPEVLQDIRLEDQDFTLIEYLIQENQVDILTKILNAVSLNEQSDSFFLTSNEGPLYIVAKQENWNVLDLLFDFLSKTPKINFLLSGKDLDYIESQQVVLGEDATHWGEKHRFIFLKSIVERLPIIRYTTPAKVDSFFQSFLSWAKQHNYSDYHISHTIFGLAKRAVACDNTWVLRYIDNQLLPEYFPPQPDYVADIFDYALKQSADPGTQVEGYIYLFSQHYYALKEHPRYRDNPETFQKLLAYPELAKISTVYEEKRRYESIITPLVETLEIIAVRKI